MTEWKKRPFHSVLSVMGLRTKPLAGYLVFVAALVVLSEWGAWRSEDTQLWLR